MGAPGVERLAGVSGRDAEGTTRRARDAPDVLEEARSLVGRSRRVVVLTGAGISAESGVPTFRGSDGLWRSYRAEDLATPEAFARDPELVWSWYLWRRDVIGACAPNAGHLALARFALARPGTTLVTQNVDGLHHQAAVVAAGSADPGPAIPLEIHGALHRDRCSGCRRATPGVRALPAAAGRAGLPRCDACGDLLRPDVVWFGEPLDTRLLEHAFAAARAADVCLVVGTSALVHPAASIPLATLGSGGRLIEVNPEPTPLSGRAHATLRGASAAILPELLRNSG
jgi:NAD-dependent deacetylase